MFSQDLTTILLSLVLAVFLGDFIVHEISKSWRAKIDKKDPYLKDDLGAHKEFSGIARQIGMIERALYVLSWYIGKPEFIAAWLALKVAIEWRAWNPEPLYGDEKNEHRYYLIIQRARFNNFVLGNALSLLCAMVAIFLVSVFV